MKKDPNVIICPVCGRAADRQFGFCPWCGKEFEPVRHCPNCGAEIDGEDLFCSKCGAKCGDADEPAPHAEAEAPAEPPKPVDPRLTLTFICADCREKLTGITGESCPRCGGTNLKSICRSCGSLNDSGEEICLKCGKPIIDQPKVVDPRLTLTFICADCREKSTGITGESCPHCGSKKLKSVCQNCGSLNDSGEEICLKCGKPVIAPPKPSGGNIRTVRIPEKPYCEKKERDLSEKAEKLRKEMISMLCVAGALLFVTALCLSVKELGRTDFGEFFQYFAWQIIAWSLLGIIGAIVVLGYGLKTDLYQAQMIDGIVNLISGAAIVIITIARWDKGGDPGMMNPFVLGVGILAIIFAGYKLYKANKENGSDN